MQRSQELPLGFIFLARKSVRKVEAAAVKKASGPPYKGIHCPSRDVRATAEALPPDAVLTRRFGVSQTSFDVSLGQVKKVRPIDDYTASLINLTNGSVETINPHGVDCVLSAASFRLRKGRKLGLKERLFARTIDLRKAYKQLPISERSLSDSFLSVLNPHTDQPEIYCSKVLPFGARAACPGLLPSLVGPLLDRCRRRALSLDMFL